MRTALTLTLAALMAACSTTSIIVTESGEIDFHHRQIGTDIVGLSWQSSPAEDGGRFVDASMNAVVRPGEESSAQSTLRHLITTTGSTVIGAGLAGAPGAGVGLVASQIDWSSLPGTGPSEKEIREELREELTETVEAVLIEWAIAERVRAASADTR